MSAPDSGTDLGRDDGRTPDIVLCPGGPALLRGDHVVEDEDGRRHATTRPVSAVCRCGHTATSPWCDGTHKVARSGRRGRAGRD